MIDHAEDGTFAAVLVRIRNAAATVPEDERVGFVKGMIRECPEITSPADRDALFQLVALVGSAARATAPAAPASINVNQNVNQTVAPHQTVTQTGSGIVNSEPKKKSSVVPIIVAVITAIGVILAAIITSRSSNVGPEAARPKIDSAPTITADTLGTTSPRSPKKKPDPR